MTFARAAAAAARRDRRPAVGLCDLAFELRRDAGRQARAGEDVPRTTGPGLAACRWATPRARGEASLPT